MHFYLFCVCVCHFNSFLQFCCLGYGLQLFSFLSFNHFHMYTARNIIAISFCHSIVTYFNCFLNFSSFLCTAKKKLGRAYWIWSRIFSILSARFGLIYYQLFGETFPYFFLCKTSKAIRIRSQIWSSGSWNWSFRQFLQEKCRPPRQNSVQIWS